MQRLRDKEQQHEAAGPLVLFNAVNETEEEENVSEKEEESVEPERPRFFSFIDQTELQNETVKNETSEDKTKDDKIEITVPSRFKRKRKSEEVSGRLFGLDKPAKQTPAPIRGRRRSSGKEPKQDADSTNNVPAAPIRGRRRSSGKEPKQDADSTNNVPAAPIRGRRRSSEKEPKQDANSTNNVTAPNCPKRKSVAVNGDVQDLPEKKKGRPKIPERAQIKKTVKLKSKKDKIKKTLKKLPPKSKHIKKTIRPLRGNCVPVEPTPPPPPQPKTILKRGRKKSVDSKSAKSVETPVSAPNSGIVFKNRKFGSFLTCSTLTYFAVFNSMT